MKDIAILAMTSEEYSHAMVANLKKGSQQAKHLYQEWFQEGSHTGKNPSFNNAPNLLREMIDHTDFSFLSCTDVHKDDSADKILFQTKDGLKIESVLIQMKAGLTLCVSSQIGCRMGCTFCETGKMGFIRHLNTQEIVSQIFILKSKLKHPIRNIVFMGMGEPLDNFESVMQAFKVIIDPYGFGFGQNHITLSTSGRIDGIERLIEENGPIPHLAVSLNAANDTLRNALMPINRRFPLPLLYATMKRFCEKKNQEILIGYIMLKGINDSPQHAEELSQFLKGLSVRINLIPYSAQRNAHFASSDSQTLHTFATILRNEGYNTLIRHSKGDQIMAACGQLGFKPSFKFFGKKLSRLLSTVTDI